MSIEPRMRFGRWMTIEKVPGCRRTDRRAAWRCRCDCGTERTVATGELKRGKSQSCGCRSAEHLTRLSTTHRMSRSIEYTAWHAMKNRCHNSNVREFKYYGARVIAVCQRWRDSFSDFYADMGPRPSLNHSIDRLDNERGYEPDNCEWRDTFQQSRNRRTTRLLTAFGKTQCVVDWANEYGLSLSCLFARLRKGVPLESALTIPLNHGAQLRAATARPKL